MKTLLVFLIIVALAGAAFGAYTVFVQQPIEPVSINSQGEGNAATEADILALKGEIGVLKEDYENRIDELEGIIGQQAQKIEQINRQVASLRGDKRIGADNPGDSDSISGEAVSNSNLSSMDKEALKELLGELNNERRRDQREQQNERMQQQFSEFRQRQISKVSEKFNWDEQKKQQVADILALEKSKIDEIREQSRNQDLNQDQRREILGQIREVNEATQESLKALMSEEEYGEFQKSTRLRRNRRPGNQRGNRPRQGGR